jgi:hypothetical protein
MARIQLITILLDASFIAYIGYLIVKGRLREEYSIVWLASSAVLTVFSFWREGLDVVSGMLGIYDPPNMVFTACIFMILVYLLHLSVKASAMQRQAKVLAQEIALLKEQLRANAKTTTDEQ